MKQYITCHIFAKTGNKSLITLTTWTIIFLFHGFGQAIMVKFHISGLNLGPSQFSIVFHFFLIPETSYTIIINRVVLYKYKTD
jgi:hypothetical protein